MLTNRALIRVRLKHLELAIEDVQEVPQVPPDPAIAYRLYCDGDRSTRPGR